MTFTDLKVIYYYFGISVVVIFFFKFVGCILLIDRYVYSCHLFELDNLLILLERNFMSRLYVKGLTGNTGIM